MTRRRSVTSRQATPKQLLARKFNQLNFRLCGVRANIINIGKQHPELYSIIGTTIHNIDNMILTSKSNYQKKKALL